MNDKINLKKDGADFEGNIICYFQNTTNSKKYVFYTKSEEDTPNSPTIKIHVALISQPDITLNAPISDDEWSNLKGIMGNVLKGVENPDISYLKTNDALTISDEKVIGMPSSYDYVNKHKSVYLNGAKEDTPAQQGPIIPEPDAPSTTPEAPAAAPTDVNVQTPTMDAAPTPGFGGPMESVITPTNVEDVNPIQSLIADSPQEAAAAEDKPLPKMPEAPEPAAPITNDNIQIPETPQIEEPTISEIVPTTPEVPKDEPKANNNNEINDKLNKLIDEINEIKKLIESPSKENSVGEAPAAPAAPSAPEAPQASGDEGVNWFDMPS